MKAVNVDIDLNTVGGLIWLPFTGLVVRVDGFK